MDEEHLDKSLPASIRFGEQERLAVDVLVTLWGVSKQAAMRRAIREAAGAITTDAQATPGEIHGEGMH